MTQEQARSEAVGLLQDLGLKEYEARCFLALTQLSSATAKEISEVSEVPRTRVYDAIRVLEAEGLVEVHHSSPQRFRAVDVDEAIATLRRKYDDRLETLQSHLERVDLAQESPPADVMQEVWSLSGGDGIRSRTYDMLEEAESEIVLLVVEEAILTETLFDRLRDAADRGVDVLVGVLDGAAVDSVRSELPDAEVFETELEWLVGPETGVEGPKEEVAISRVLFVDRTTVLVSSYYPSDGDEHDEPTERAIFADGLGNGIVVLLRRLVSTGLLPTEDPGR